jgi:DNA-binding XRE family transcriptional regulator
MSLANRRPVTALPAPAERKRLRELFAVTQDELAIELGVTRKTVYSWERREPIRPGNVRDAYAALLASWAHTESTVGAVITDALTEGSA